MDEYDLESESIEEANQQQPDWAKQQVSQANKEAQRLRAQLREREQEILTSRYEGVIDLLPEEVTSYDAKVAFLEKANKRFSERQEAPVTPETSSEEPPAPEAEVPAETLAGIVNGPSGSASGTSGHVTKDDWLKLIETDPAEAERLFKAEKVDLSNLRQGLGPDR